MRGQSTGEARPPPPRCARPREVANLAYIAAALRLAAEFEEEHLGVAVAQAEAQRVVVADEVSGIGFRDAGPFFSIHAVAGFSDKDCGVMKSFPSSVVRSATILLLGRAIGAGCVPQSVVRLSQAAIPVIPWNS